MTRSVNSTMLARLGFGDSDRSTSEHDLACRYVYESRIAFVQWLEGDEWLNSPVRESILQCRAYERLYGDNEAHADCVRCPRPIVRCTDVVTVSASLERALQKGERGYATTVGFLDVVIEYQKTTRCEFQGWTFEPTAPEPVAYCEKPKASSPDETWAEWGRSQGKQAAYERAHKLYYEWTTTRAASEKEACAPLQGCPRRAVVEVKSRISSVNEVIRQLALYREYINASAWILAAPVMLSECDERLLLDHGIHYAPLGPRYEQWKLANGA